MANGSGRKVSATFARRPIQPDPPHEWALAEHWKDSLSLEERLAAYDRFHHGQTKIDATMRRILLRSMVRSMGHDVTIDPGFSFRHPGTFEIGDGVFIGANAFIQGRHDGRCVIGRRCWLGPGAYFDARDL